MSVGEQIKKARKAVGLTQEKLAGEKYSASYISQIEKGHIRPSLKALEYIAGRLNKPIGFFCDDPGEVERIAEKQQIAMRVEFLISLGESYLANGQLNLAIDNLEQAKRLLGDPGAQELSSRLLRHLGKVRSHLHDWDQAEEHFKNALAQFIELDDTAEVIRTYFDLGQMFFFQQNYKRAENYFNKALKMAESKRSIAPDILIDVWRNLGVISTIKGRLDDAEQLYSKALACADSASDPTRLASIYMNLSLNCVDNNDLDKAIDYSKKALTLFESVNNRRRTAEVLTNAGMVLSKQGKTDEALDFLNRSFKIFETLNDNKSSAYVMTELAKVELSSGSLDQAEAYAKRALVISEEFTDEIEKARLYAVLGELAQRRKDWTSAKQYFKKSIDILEESEFNVEFTDVLRQFSELLLNMGETEDAASHLKKAIDSLGRS